MSRSFEVEFKIRQHTPIIHFQYDQDGASLRISELKPAFDRYLWEKALKRNFDTYKSCLVSYSLSREKMVKQEFEKENWALDYRISIDYADPLITPMHSRFPCFFGNLGEDNQHIERKFSFIEQDFNINFICFHELLREKINAHFHNFLRTKNFGLRQSKGFGSFTTLLPRTSDQQLVPVTPATPESLRCYKFQVLSHDISNLFSHIDLFWKVIRSGFNKPNRNKNTIVYMKSPLFFYLKDKWNSDIDFSEFPNYKYLEGRSFQLEKRTIKQTYFSRKLSDQQNNYDFSDILNEYPSKSQANNYFLFRDLFGLASSSQWLGYHPNSITKEHLPVKNEETIERFKSPITIKPIKTKIGFDIYVCYSPIPEQYSSQKFKIKAGDQNRLTVETPPKGSFLFSKYFQYIVDEYKWKITPINREGNNEEDPDPSVVTLTNSDDPDWKKIKNIFGSFVKV